jgi:hypothetical protein
MQGQAAAEIHDATEGCVPDDFPIINLGRIAPRYAQALGAFE